MTATVEQPAVPCPGQTRSGIRSLAGRGISLVAVLASADVPDAVYEARMASCRACPHRTFYRGRHWCGCCGCPRWNLGRTGSSLEFKNRKAAWACPKPEPAFGPWEDE